MPLSKISFISFWPKGRASIPIVPILRVTISLILKHLSSTAKSCTLSIFPSLLTICSICAIVTERGCLCLGCTVSSGSSTAAINHVLLGCNGTKGVEHPHVVWHSCYKILYNRVLKKIIKGWEGECSWSWWGLGQHEVIMEEIWILVMSSKVFKNQEHSLTTFHLSDMQWQDGRCRQS